MSKIGAKLALFEANISKNSQYGDSNSKTFIFNVAKNAGGPTTSLASKKVVPPRKNTFVKPTGILEKKQLSPVNQKKSTVPSKFSAKKVPGAPIESAHQTPPPPVNRKSLDAEANKKRSSSPVYQKPSLIAKSKFLVNKIQRAPATPPGPSPSTDKFCDGDESTTSMCSESPNSVHSTSTVKSEHNMSPMHPSAVKMSALNGIPCVDLDLGNETTGDDESTLMLDIGDDDYSLASADGHYSTDSFLEPAAWGEKSISDDNSFCAVSRRELLRYKRPSRRFGRIPEHSDGSDSSVPYLVDYESQAGSRSSLFSSYDGNDATSTSSRSSASSSDSGSDDHPKLPNPYLTGAFRSSGSKKSDWSDCESDSESDSDNETEKEKMKRLYPVSKKTAAGKQRKRN